MRTLLVSILHILIFAVSGVMAQETDITAQLQQIEKGEIEKVKTEVQSLKKVHPKDPSVLFLDALVTSDGKEALGKYSLIFEKYPNSRYADASLYWVYSYYYALGYYNKAGDYMGKLKSNYPNSIYIKSAPVASSGGKQTDSPEVHTAAQTNPGGNTPEQKTSVNSNASNGKYTIQAGAFLVQSNAVKLKNNLEEAGYFSEIKEKEIAGSTLNVVNVGRFENEEEAKKTLSFINTRYKLNGRVIPIEQ